MWEDFVLEQPNLVTFGDGF